MIKTLLIARREYMAYARTVGFWLSLLALPVFGALGAAIPVLMDRSEPTREVAVLDLTTPDEVQGLIAPGQGLADHVERERATAVASAIRRAARGEAGQAEADRLRDLAETEGQEAALAQLEQSAPLAARGFTPPRPPVVLVEAPAELASATTPEAAEAALRELLVEDGPLDAAVVLTGSPRAPEARVWSVSTTDRTVELLTRDALREINRANTLIAAGIDPGAIRALDSYRPQVQAFSPRSASGGEVSIADRLPGLVGFILGMLLWSAVITGASILLNSVMEEKANRVLEVLLSSASATQVLTGKVLGVAGITLTVVAVWGLFAAAGLGFAAQALPTFARDMSGALGALMEGGTLAWLMAYFIGGYLMYAVVFAAVGAFCETPRDAQTLIGPIMMVLIVPIVVMQIAIRNPDVGVVKVLSWVPFFTPFLMSARVPSDPPLFEMVGTLAIMALTALIMIWLAGKAFRAGALSTIKLDWRTVGQLVRGRGLT